MLSSACVHIESLVEFHTVEKVKVLARLSASHPGTTCRVLCSPTTLGKVVSVARKHEQEDRTPGSIEA